MYAAPRAYQQQTITIRKARNSGKRSVWGSLVTAFVASPRSFTAKIGLELMLRTTSQQSPKQESMH